MTDETVFTVSTTAGLVGAAGGVVTEPTEVTAPAAVCRTEPAAAVVVDVTVSTACFAGAVVFVVVEPAAVTAPVAAAGAEVAAVLVAATVRSTTAAEGAIA